MHWKNWLKLIGIALLAWILSSVDWQQATQSLLKLNSAYLMGYVLCFAAMMLVRTLRLRIAVSKLGYSLSFGDCYVAILEPAFIGSVTPGRLGEFTRVGYIHAHGLSMQEAVSVVTIERLIDIGVLLVFGVGGMIYIFAPVSYHFSSGLFVAIGLLMLFAAIHEYEFLFRFLQKPIVWKLRWEPSFLTRHRPSLITSFHGVMIRAAMPIFLLGLVCIILNFGQIFLLAKAFGFEADYLVVIFAYAAATLVSLLPISVGGLGTREASYVMIMAQEGILKEQALLFSLIDGVVLGIFGLMALFIPILILRLIKMHKLTNYISVAINSFKKRGLKKTLLFIVGEYWFDIRFRVSTRPYLLNGDDSIVGSNLFNAAPHYGTNWFILKAVFQDLICRNLINPASAHMVDFGCGAGRALMAAQLFGIAKVTGVEFSQTLCLRAEENLRQFTKKNARIIDLEWKVEHADACTFKIPQDASLFFLYNPFGDPVIDIVAKNILEFSRSEKRSIIVIYVNPIHATVFERLGYLKLQESSEEVGIYACC